MSIVDLLVQNERTEPIASCVVTDCAVQGRGRASAGCSNDLVEALAPGELVIGVAEERLTRERMAFDGDDEVKVGGSENGDVEHGNDRT
tara:strand:- start:2120 stop:2386 length:267 start_codon:yes stop_codon:yes gene_type:complete